MSSYKVVTVIENSTKRYFKLYQEHYDKDLYDFDTEIRWTKSE